MFISGDRNYGILAFSIVLVLINAVTEIFYKCSGIFGTLLGMLVGITFALLYYSLLLSSDVIADHVYFHDSVSNNVQCSKPGSQNFKCSVYKNGDPIAAVGM